MSNLEKKQLKAQLTNEISKRFRDRINELECSRNALRTKIAKERQMYNELQGQYLELSQEFERVKEWNERLLEYFDLDENAQEEYFKELKSKKDFSDALDKLIKMSSIFFGAY